MFNLKPIRFLEVFGLQGCFFFPMALPVLAALRRFHGMPVIIAAGGHALGVLTAQLALLAPAALAALLHAGLHLGIQGSDQKWCH
jgi:hypothetical protein